MQFDNQTNYYGTFKLETVGDSYIVLSGVPEPIEDHADRVVEMGLAMVHVTRTIFSPADGKHIEVGPRADINVNGNNHNFCCTDANWHSLGSLHGWNCW